MVKKKEGTSSEGKSDRKSYGIRLTPELVKALKRIAVEREMPVNRVLEEAIQDYIKKNKGI